MGHALGGGRPIRMPSKVERALGRTAQTWTDVFGLALSTTEDDEIILVSDPIAVDIIPTP